MNPDLSATICDKQLETPLVLAAGFLGTEVDLLERVASAGAGAVTTKTCGLKPREGHENPTIIAWDHGILNAVGLTNPGAEKQIGILKKLRGRFKEQRRKTLIVASFFGSTVDEFVKVGRMLAEGRPDFLEMNISCPNVEAEHGRPFGCDPKVTHDVTKKVKREVSDIPIIVKLSPNVTDIREIAKAAENGGADVLSAINTVGAMIIDAEAGKPILTNKFGGISGPAVRPVAVKCVYQMAQTVDIPIIGLGGVSTGKEAVEMIMAGASVVGLGTAIYYRGMSVFNEIQKEMEDFMTAHNYKSLDDIRGLAHED